MRSLFVPRILALCLSVGLGLPPPALALRPVGLEEANPGVREEVKRALGVPPGHPEAGERTGLEEPTGIQTTGSKKVSKLRQKQIIQVLKHLLGLRRIDQLARLMKVAEFSDAARIRGMAQRGILLEFLRFYEENPDTVSRLLEQWFSGMQDSEARRVRERMLEVQQVISRQISSLKGEHAAFQRAEGVLWQQMRLIAKLADPSNDIVKMLGPVFEKFKDVDLVTPYAVADKFVLVRSLIEEILEAYGHKNARYYSDDQANIRYSSWGRHIERVPSSVRALVAVRFVYYTDDVEGAVASKLIPILKEVRDSGILQRELRGARFNNGSAETIAREILNAFGHARDELLGTRWDRPIEGVPTLVRALPALLDEFEKAAKRLEESEAESNRHRQILEEFTQLLLAEVDRRLPAVQPMLLPLGSSRFLEEFGAGATQEDILARYSVMTDAQRDQVIAFVVGYRDALHRLSYRARSEAEDFLFRLIQSEFTDSRQPGTLARALVVRDKSRRMAKAVSSLIAGLDLPVEMRMLYENSRSQGRLLKQHAAQERAAEQIREARALAEAIEELNQSLQPGEPHGFSRRALPPHTPQLPAGSDVDQTSPRERDSHREGGEEITSAGLEEVVSVEEFGRRFPGVAVPEGVKRVYLVPGKTATTIHIYAHDTLLSDLEKVASQELEGLPEGLKVEVRSLPSSVDALEQPGLIAQDWLLELLYVQALLPVLKMAVGEKPPSLSSLVLYALRGQAGQVEAVVRVMTLQDAQGQTFTAYFV